MAHHQLGKDLAPDRVQAIVAYLGSLAGTLPFSRKCRHFCPSFHAKRLAIWTQWLDSTLLAPVPHR